jgi:hypothetical protein
LPYQFPCRHALLGPAPMPADAVTVEQPKHPMYALTTYELRDFRRDLERAIAYFDKQDPYPRHGLTCKPSSMTCWRSRRAGRGRPVPDDRPHDVSGLTTDELERARRDLAVSLALVDPDSPVRVPIVAQLSAIDTELAGRTGSGPDQ